LAPYWRWQSETESVVKVSLDRPTTEGDRRSSAPVELMTNEDEQGIDDVLNLEQEVHVGDELRVGSVLLEVTQPRTPCVKLAVGVAGPHKGGGVERGGGGGVWGGGRAPGGLGGGGRGQPGILGGLPPAHGGGFDQK
jgi:hypothetical protein